MLTADEQVAVILAADARRVRRLTWATVAFWGLTVLAAGLAVGAFHKQLRHAVTEVNRHMAQEFDPNFDADIRRHNDRVTLAFVLGQVQGLGDNGLHLSLSVGLLALSALGTILLVHASRRATLRQIRASLAAIAGQLADVQRGRGTMPPTAGG